MSTPTDSNFIVRNTLVVNTAFWANSTGLYFGSSPTFSLNSAVYQGTANNANSLGGASYTSYPNTSGNFTMGGKITFSANTLHNANLIVNTSIVANGTVGTAGQVLVSNGTNPYWGDANNSLYLGGTAASGYQTTAGLSANVATLAANAATYLNGQLASYYTNATNISTGTLSQSRLANVVFCNVSGQQINGGGVRVTPYTIPQGNTTLDSGNGPIQYYLNSQTATITAPSNDGSFLMFINNAASANTLTWSGFTYASSNFGDPYVLSANNKFLFHVSRVVGISTIICKALQ